MNKKDYMLIKKQTILDCIALLKTDGKGTKQEVLKKLEELVK